MRFNDKQLFGLTPKDEDFQRDSITNDIMQRANTERLSYDLMKDVESVEMKNWGAWLKTKRKFEATKYESVCLSGDLYDQYLENKNTIQPVIRAYGTDIDIYARIEAGYNTDIEKAVFEISFFIINNQTK